MTDNKNTDKTGEWMRMISRDRGLGNVWVDNDDDASTLGRYWNAVKNEIRGEAGTYDLSDFTGMTVAGHELETDPDVILYYAVEGEIYDDEINYGPDR